MLVTTLKFVAYATWAFCSVSVRGIFSLMRPTKELLNIHFAGLLRQTFCGGLSGGRRLPLRRGPAFFMGPAQDMIMIAFLRWPGSADSICATGIDQDG